MSVLSVLGQKTALILFKKKIEGGKPKSLREILKEAKQKK